MIIFPSLAPAAFAAALLKGQASVGCSSAVPAPIVHGRWFAPSQGFSLKWGAASRGLRVAVAQAFSARLRHLCFGLAWSGNERFGRVQTAPNFHSHIIITQAAFLGNLAIVEAENIMFPEEVFAFRL